MPNGGSDCCGTCWFNKNNNGKPGYHGSKKVSVARCTIRDIDIPNPFWTYCANHPHHTREKINLPLGPVYVAELMDGFASYARKVWLNPPDNEKTRLKLLELLDSISGDIEQKYPSQTNLEEEIISQLMTLEEKRAVPGLLKITKLNIEKYRYWDKDKVELIMIKNKAITVGQAIEALLKISGEKYLHEVSKFIYKGLDNSNERYDMRLDNFAIIRYHLVRGLQYVNNNESIELLKIAKNDLHDEVRKFAKEILNKKLPEMVLFWQGLEHARNHEYEKAIECYNKALKIKPDEFDFYFELGNTYWDKNEHDEGIKHYTLALTIEPDNYFALYNRGRSYFDLGEYEKAIIDFEKVLNLEFDKDIDELLNKAKQKTGETK
jgi:tetratricopeptide (TPR) repeat protein